jgi:hypothetical protein
MQRAPLLALLLAAMAASCLTPQGPWMPTFVDPAYRDAAFRSVAVLADTGAYAWRKDFESSVATALSEEKVAATQASWFITPTREWTSAQIRETLLAKGFDACLDARVIASEFSSNFIPEERVTTTEKVPIVEKFRVKVDGRYVEKDSIVGYRNVRKTTKDGGYSREREYRTFRLSLTDLRSGTIAWTAEYAGYADEFSLRTFSQNIARQLLWDKIVRTNEAPAK